MPRCSRINLGQGFPDDFGPLALREAGVATIPLSAFIEGNEPSAIVRLCHCKEAATLTEAMRRLRPSATACYRLPGLVYRGGRSAKRRHPDRAPPAIVRAQHDQPGSFEMLQKPADPPR